MVLPLDYLDAFSPINPVVPFTYRDTATNLTILFSLEQRLNELITNINDVALSNTDNINLAIEALTDSLNALLADSLEEINASTATLVAMEATLQTLQDTLATDQASIAAALADITALHASIVSDLAAKVDEDELEGDVVDFINTSTTVKAAGDARWLRANRLGFFVKNFGAKGDGVTDDTAAIQACINAAQAAVTDPVGRQRDGATVYFEKGSYLISSTLTVSSSAIWVRGESAVASQLFANAANFTLLSFDNGVGPYMYNCGVSDLGFNTPGDTTAGYHLSLKHIINLWVNNIISHGAFGGLLLGSVNYAMLNNVILDQTTRLPTTSVNGAAVTINNPYALCSDIHISNMQIANAVATAAQDQFIVTGVDGLYIDQLHMHGRFALAPDNTGVNTTCASVHVSNSYFDASREACVNFGGAASSAYRGFRFANCYFRQGVYGVKVDTTALIEEIVFTGCTFAQNKTSGLEVVSAFGKLLKLTGCLFSENNTDNLIGGDILLNGQGCDLEGITFSGGGSVGRAALAIAAAATRVNLVGISFSSSNAATRLLNPVPAQTRYRGIFGVVLKSSGIMAVPNAATTVTVTHGMFATPSISQIRVTATGANLSTYYVSAVTATTFTVTFTSAATAISQIAWGIDMEV